MAPASAAGVLAEELKKQKEEYNKMENIMEEKLANKEKERHKLKCENVKLRHEIKQFNETRRPWERKLNIEIK
jgi:chromosome segregation ATPase